MKGEKIMLTQRSRILMVISSIWQIWLGISVFVRVMHQPFETPNSVSALLQGLLGGTEIVFFFIIFLFVFFETICIFLIKDIKKKASTPLLVIVIMLLCFSTALNFDVFGTTVHIILSFIIVALAFAAAVFEITVLCNQKNFLLVNPDNIIKTTPLNHSLRNKIVLIISLIWKIWFGVGILIGTPFYILSGTKMTESSVRFFPVSGEPEVQFAYTAFGLIAFIYVEMIFAFVLNNIKIQKRVLNFALTLIYSVGVSLVSMFVTEPMNYIWAISVLILGAALMAFEITVLLKSKKTINT